MFGPLKFLLFACVFPFISSQEQHLKNALKQFQCGEKSVPFSWLCDGEPDCQNKEDESPALCNTTQTCEPNQFKCKNGLCITKTWLCDNQADCSDGSDEHEENCYQEKCTDDQFACKNTQGVCIPKNWECDGHADCPDHSDELFCTKKCDNKHFTCKNGRCIDHSLQCNSFDDCGDNSDEVECALKTCSKNEFTCANGECITLSWLCDGHADCTDNSDELNCKNSTSYNCNKSPEDCLNDANCKNQAWICDGVDNCINGMDESPILCNQSFQCPHNYFQCNDGACIPEHQKCSGQKECLDGSDELDCPNNELCNSKTHFDCGNGKCVPLKDLCGLQEQCANFGVEQKKYCTLCQDCEHMCRWSPHGHFCDCEPGFKLSKNGKNCEDVNECELPGTCSQICINTIGSYQCSCEEGYITDPRNPTKCIAPIRPYLLIASNKEIRNVSTEYEPTKTISKVNANGVDYSYIDNLVFWSDLTNKVIVKKDNLKETTLISKVTAEDIAVDYVHKYIYWTDSSKGTIEMCDFNGNKRYVILENLILPRAISVDPVNNWIFWSSWGEFPKIEKARLDGSSRQVLIHNRIGWPNGITLEPNNNRIYWTDAKEHKLFSCNYFGGERRVIPVEMQYLKHPYSLTTFEDVLYWGDWDTAAIYKTNKYTGGRVEYVTPVETHNNPMSMKIFHSYVQKALENPCEALQCSFVCLKGNEKNYCVCPKGETLLKDGRSCMAIDTTTIKGYTSVTNGISTLEDTTTQEITTRSSSTIHKDIESELDWLWILLICMGCIVIVLLCGVCLYRFVVKVKNKGKVKIHFTENINNRKVKDSASLFPRKMSAGLPKSVEIEVLEPLNYKGNEVV